MSFVFVESGSVDHNHVTRRDPQDPGQPCFQSLPHLKALLTLHLWNLLHRCCLFSHPQGQQNHLRRPSNPLRGYRSGCCRKHSHRCSAIYSEPSEGIVAASSIGTPPGKSKCWIVNSVKLDATIWRYMAVLPVTIPKPKSNPPIKFIQPGVPHKDNPSITTGAGVTSI